MCIRDRRRKRAGATMGGYFSTRWNYERTRADTDGLLRLDVRHMQRTGVFHPGAHATWQWTRDDGESAGTIQTRINRAGDCLTLDYATPVSYTHLRAHETVL